MGSFDEARAVLNGEVAERIPWEEPLIPFELRSDDEQERARMSLIVNTIVRGSPFGKQLLENVYNSGYALKMEEQSGVSGFCRESKKEIVLNSIMSTNKLVSTLVHESRHAQQNQNLPWSEDPDKRDFISGLMLYRAMEADAQVAAVTACYEILKNTGNDGPYDCMSAYNPLIVKGFINAKKEQSDQVTPEMMQGAFNGWYENKAIVDRYEEYYFTESMNAAIERGRFSTEAYEKPLTSAQIVQAYCTDMNGECYWKNDPDVLSDRNKLSISSQTRKVVDKFFAAREEKTGMENSRTHSDLKVRGGASLSESCDQLKRAFSGEYVKNFKRDLNAEVAIEKECSLLEKQRLNHLINEVCKDKDAKKDLEALKSAGYSLAMESLGKSVSMRDDRNKVVVLARRGSDQVLQEALKKEARNIGKTFETMRMKQTAHER